MYAATNSWDFSTSSDYTYDNSKIEFSSGQAQLKATSNWYSTDWKYRKKITIGSSNFQTNLSDFSLLIKLSSDSDLSAKALSNGNDLLFTSADGVTKLNHEIEQYTSLTGLLVAWVKIPTVSSSSDTDIYIYYGNASSPSQASVTNTWDSNNVAVWHLNNSSSPVSDSTVNANNGTQQNGVTFNTSGKIGGAISFDGVNDYVSAANSNSLNATAGLTISAWINRTATGKMRLIAKTVTTGATNNPYDFGIGTDDKLYFNRANASAVSFMTGSTTVPANTWTKVGVVVGGQVPLAFNNISKLITLSTALRAKQGVASDGTYLYVVTDQISGLNNVISKFDLSGNLIQEKTSAYNPFPAGNFYSFGNATVINGKLYVGTYNANFLGASSDINYTPTSNLKSRIAVFNLSDLSLIQDYDLGTQIKIAEGVDYHDGYFWVIDGWFNTFTVKKYDDNFNLIATYSLPVVSPFSNELTYQNINWRGNEIFVNWHGSDTFGLTYAHGLDRYSFDGTNFTFVERLKPVVYGAGQGIAIIGDTFYWADRPGNAIYKSTYVGTGNGDFTDFSTVDFIVNGVRTAANEGSVAISDPTSNSSATLIGTRGDLSSFYKGAIDELRITNLAKSSAWITASYNNENSPDTFYILGSETKNYSYSDPIVNPATSNARTFTSLSGFSETATKNGGEIKYQISNDSGTTWYWYSSGWTTTSSGYSEANTAANINSNIATFPVGSGSFLFKAYLNSDGTQLIQLDSVDLTYENILPTSTPSSSSNSSTTSTLTCNAESPGAKVPHLYGAIAKDSSSIEIFFTDADKPVDHYVLQYGTRPGEYQYGIDSFGEVWNGQQSYVVKSLSPNSTYYFRVRGGNGCATGPWSNEISATTKSITSFKNLQFTESKLEAIPTNGIGSCTTHTVKPGESLWSIASQLMGDGTKFPSISEQNKNLYPSLESSNNLNVGWKLKINCENNQEQSQKDTSSLKEIIDEEGYKVKIKVTDTANKPVEGANVTIHSKVQEGVTDRNGIATFENVEKGDHRVIIAYNGFEGEQALNLTGDTKEFSLEIKIKPQNVIFSPVYIISISVAAAIIATLVVLLFRKRK